MSSIRRRLRRSASRRSERDAAVRFPPLSSVAAALGAGGALALAYPPISLWPGAFAAIGLLAFACQRTPPLGGAISGGLSGIAFFVLAWPWMAPSIARLQEISVVDAVPIFGLYVAWHSLQFALFGFFVASQRDLAPTSCAGIAAAWVVLEAMFPRVIPWQIADTLAPVATLRQLAELGGPRLLGFAVVFCGAAATATMVNGTSASRLRAALCGCGLVGATVVFGLVREPVDASVAPLSVVVVQAGSSAGHAAATSASKEAAWEAYAHATRTFLNRSRASPDLIVWPETVVRAAVLRRPAWRRRIQELSAEVDAPLLLGVLDRDASGGEFNAALLVDPFRRIHPHPTAREHPLPRKTQLYRKQILLPFGEYVPGVSSLIADWQTTGDFVAGDTSSLLRVMSRRWPEVPPQELAASICFEAVVPGFFHEAVRAGALLLVNLTDDGWFGNGAQPEQHLNATRLRAVETRRWLIRASGSGISAVISPAGEVAASLAYGEVGALEVEVQPVETVTLYARTGDAMWVAFAALLAVVAATLGRWPSPRRRSGNLERRSPPPAAFTKALDRWLRRFRWRP